VGSHLSASLPLRRARSSTRCLHLACHAPCQAETAACARVCPPPTIASPHTLARQPRSEAIARLMRPLDSRGPKPSHASPPCPSITSPFPVRSHVPPPLLELTAVPTGKCHCEPPHSFPPPLSPPPSSMQVAEPPWHRQLSRSVPSTPTAPPPRPTLHR
jgi:hypothetical protein